jgi:hypothetical protein
VDWLTVERTLYGLCLLAAATLRFQGLGRDTLSPGEAAAVWPAWVSATRGDGPSLPTADPPTSALLFSLHWFLFWLTGAAGEALVRWPAAALGTGLVLLPWALRPIVGRTAALLLAALLATDPFLVSSSRTADGASASAFCALLVLVSVARRGRWATAQTASDSARSAREILPAIALGLLLVSGTSAWSVLILLALGIAAFPSHRARAQDSLARSGAIVLVTATLAATAGLAQWEGPPLVSVSLGAWIRAWASNVDRVAVLAELVSSMVQTQPLLIVLPIVALVSVRRRGAGRPRLLLSILVLLAAALAVGQADTLAGRLALVMLLAMLAAQAGNRLIAEVTALLRSGTTRDVVLGGALALAVGFLVLSTIRAGVNGHLTAARPPDGIRLLARDVAALCAGRVGAAFACSIDIVADPWPEPLLGWYLGTVAPIRWVLSPALEEETRHRLVVSLGAAASLERDSRLWSAPASYVGSEYRTSRLAHAGGRIVLWVPRE